MDFSSRKINKKAQELTKGPFSKIRAIRELQREKAGEIYEALIALAQAAIAGGDFKTAATIYWKLFDHTPADEDGTRVIDASASAPPKEVDGPKGPTIQIGIALGGMSQPKQIQGEVIDVTPKKDE